MIQIRISYEHEEDAKKVIQLIKGAFGDVKVKCSGKGIYKTVF